MTSVITLSDSDDSDDLPSFADRVKQLLNAEKKETNCKILPKGNASQIHPLSDSDDSNSRDTIPFGSDKNASPISTLLNSPCKPNQKVVWSSDDEISIVHCETASGVNGVPPFTNHDHIMDSNDLPDLYNYQEPLFKSNYVTDRNYLPDLEDQEPLVTNNRATDRNYLPDLDDHEPLFRNNHITDRDYLPDLDDQELLFRKSPKLLKKNANTYDGNTSSDDEVSVRKKKKINKEKKNDDPEKELKKQMRLEKKKEKELMKALKASEKEIMKSQKPEESLKNMKIVIDHNILYLVGSQSCLNFLDQNNLTYSVEENNCNHSVIWFRKVINVCTENNEILKEEREELEDTLVLIIPNEDFLKMIHAYALNSKGKSCNNLSLQEYIVNIQSLYPNSKITCLIVGFQSYMRNIKEEGNFDMKTIAKQVPKNACEEAIIELQLQSSVNFNFLDNMNEVGNLLFHFTKAIAAAPQKREKENQKSLAFSWYADIDSHCPIKLSKDGSSFIKLWKQQVQQFQNVSPEVAEAIVSQYPSPRLLLKAYNRLTVKDAENLLQDIVVRRNYGPLGTQKRIGPELSYKLYLFFTSRDGSKLLKR